MVLTNSTIFDKYQIFGFVKKKKRCSKTKLEGNHHQICVLGFFFITLIRLET